MTTADKKLLLIINPCSGTKKICTNLVEVTDIFNRAGYTVITYITESSKDATEKIMQCDFILDLIVCCGGDGTFNETVSGVVGSNRSCPIGYIPAGSTNDFASSINLPGDIEDAAKTIVNGMPHKMDIGKFNDRYFSYVASFGIFTKTSYSTPQEMKNTLGHLAYLLNGVKELSQLKSYNVSFTVQDGTKFSDEYIFGAISNSTSLGGVMKLDDSLVDMQDGRFELLLIKAPKNLKELAECVYALRTKNFDSNFITFTEIISVDVESPADMDWSIDGEMEKGHENIHIECLHNAISICK